MYHRSLHKVYPYRARVHIRFPPYGCHIDKLTNFNFHFCKRHLAFTLYLDSKLRELRKEGKGKERKGREGKGKRGKRLIVRIKRKRREKKKNSFFF